MDPFVQQLAALCQLHPTRSKWVFVPTHGVGRTIGERVALLGTHWLNLRFVTPLDIALRMGAPFLVERGIDPSEEGLGPALIMRLLLDLPSSATGSHGTPQASPVLHQLVLGPDGTPQSEDAARIGPLRPQPQVPADSLKTDYFRPLADQPTMAQALWATIRELRMAGVKSGDLKSHAFESPAKHLELRALLGAYEQFLAAHRRGDMAVVYEEAVQHLDWCPIQPQDCWTELPDAIWTPLQRRLIGAMPGERIVPRGVAIPGATIPRRLQDAMVERVIADAMSPLAFLMQPPVASATRNRPHGTTNSEAGTAVALFNAGGREAEIEEVFRRIHAAGIPLDQAEIACASPGYDTLIWEKALRLAWPATLGTGLPIECTRPGRALLGFCEWIDSDFVSSHLRRLLESGDVRFHGIEDLTPGQAARLLVKSEAGRGRATYARSLGNLKAAYERTSVRKVLSEEVRTSAADKAARTGRLLDWINAVLLSMPEPRADGHVSLSDAVRGTLGFLSSAAAKASAVDHLAASALAESVSDLYSLGTFSCSLPTALRFIRERLEGQSIGADRPRPGHLHVSSVGQFGYAGRPAAFIVGMEEGRVFPSAVEDPVLLDMERAAISPLLRRSTDRIDEAVYGTLARLTTWGEPQLVESPLIAAHGRGLSPAPRTAASITLSYSCRDLREYRETFPSWVVLQAFRVKANNAAMSYPDLAKALGTPVSIVPADPAGALTDTGWWLSQLKTSGIKGRTPVLAQFPALGRGLDAEAQRASDAFTEFDGHVPAAGKVLDPSALERPVSPTQLEAAAECGFRHFLQRGLGVRALEDREKDGDVWIDSGTRGSELHALYAAMLRRNRKAGVPLNKKKDLAWLLARGKARLQELRDEMPPPSEEVFERECQDFLADLELFLLEECDRAPTNTPVGLEVSFGYSRDDDGDGEPEELAQQTPVVVDLGAGLSFKLAGRIDRIDEIGPGVFEVIDYKTGGYYAKKWASGEFSGGTRLQHALYGIAATQLLKRKYKGAKVARGTYYFTSAKGGQERRSIDTPTKAVLEGVLSELRTVIASGTFMHATSDEACRFCHMQAACGASDALGRVETKLTDRKLAARRRLLSYD